MKKKRIIVLLSILVVVLIIGSFAYMYFTATAVKEAFSSFDKNTVKRLNLLPERIELGTSSKPGYAIYYKDHSLMLSEYDKAITNKNLNDKFRTVYLIGDDKSVIFLDMDSFKNGFIFNGPNTSSLIEKAVGKRISSEYDFLEASFYCTPEDFSMFDENKNKGVGILLIEKSSEIGDSCYQFDNGTVRGFINIISPGVEYVLLSNCSVPDSLYKIVFYNFSMDEVKEMLSTITFDNSEAS